MHRHKMTIDLEERALHVLREGAAALGLPPTLLLRRMANLALATLINEDGRFDRHRLDRLQHVPEAASLGTRLARIDERLGALEAVLKDLSARLPTQARSLHPRDDRAQAGTSELYL